MFRISHLGLTSEYVFINNHAHILNEVSRSCVVVTNKLPYLPYVTCHFIFKWLSLHI